MPAESPILKWRAPSRAELEQLDPKARFRCACGRLARADEMYPTAGLPAFPGEWSCQGCIATARDVERRVSASAMLRAWRAPAAAIEHAETAERAGATLNGADRPPTLD